MFNDFISMIVINWNGKHFLKNCLESILNQNYDSFEILVVDCASSDGSLDFLRKNYGNTKKIRIIALDKDPGPPGAINYAVKQAKGNIVLLLNNDVVLPPECLEKMYSALNSKENSVINVVQLNFQGKIIPWTWHEPWISSWIYLFFKRIIKKTRNTVFYPSIACCLVKKTILIDIPLNEHLFLYEDIEWGWRLQLQKINIEICYDTYFLHADAGTVKHTEKQAFVNGRNLFATPFICFSSLFFVLFLPILLLEFLRQLLFFLRDRRFDLAWAFLRGNIGFIQKIKVFYGDKKNVQKKRLINDFNLLKILIETRIASDKILEKSNNSIENKKLIDLPKI